MKFVHIADMHFDSPFTLLSNTADMGEIRRLDQRLALKKIVEYIKENKIEYLFISGDLYEHEYIKQSTIEYINNLFNQIQDTKIFITPGNHDPFLNNSYYSKFNWSKNVYIFNNEITRIELNDVDIYGYGFNDFYCENSKIEDIKIINKEKINILITHADLDGGYNKEKNYNSITTKKIANIGFDYIALGHIHKSNFSEDNKKIIYPGSTISLGFDELGNHGMIVGDIEKNNLNVKFIKIDEKEFVETFFDISNINSIEELIEKIKEIEIKENIFYKIILVGKRKFEIDIYKIYKLVNIKNIIKMKDNTVLDYNLETIANDYTLKGIFAKEMLKKMSEENIDKEIIEKAIEIGMNVL